MRSAVVDFETYYGGDYTLSKMTTEAYVRDPRFETILCGFKINGGKSYWVEAADVASHLVELKLQGCAVIAHHSHFDGLILNHHYGVRPALHVDTLSMSRALHGAKGGNSLAALLKRYGLTPKGTEVSNAYGKRLRDFSTRELRAYGAYCCNDCDGEYDLAQIFAPQFHRTELELIDSIIRMFTEPMIVLDPFRLEEYAAYLAQEKLSLLIQAGLQLTDVMSSDKFAEALKFMGVIPPMKLSPKTGLPTYAFAKTDEGMIELAEHPDDVVQAMVAARLKNKSTINETRARRLIGMIERGPACVYYVYSAAGTHRLGGGDKMNWQNLQRGGKLRDAVEAPEDYLLVVGDSMNIESRMLDWITDEEEAIEAYRAFDAGTGPDIYCVMAEKIYHRVITKGVDINERQMGKVTKLGLGFGMGWRKFMIAVRQQVKLKVKPIMAKAVVNIYRSSHRHVMNFHKRCDESLRLIYEGRYGVAVDRRGIVRTCEDGLLLPNGLIIKYLDLQWKKGPMGREWTYFNGKTREKIYGGKVCENIVQALARIVVLWQLNTVPKKRKLVMSSHDEGVFCVLTKHAERTAWEVEQALKTPLDWCPDLPLNCEVGYHKSYGKAKQ